MELAVIRTLKLYWRAGAESSAYLNTLFSSLGLVGITADLFCKEFISKTAGKLPVALNLAVEVVFPAPREFRVHYNLPTSGSLISVCQFQHKQFTQHRDRVDVVEKPSIFVSQLLKISKLKFGSYSQHFFKIVFSTAKAQGLYVVWDLGLEEESATKKIV
jgi:ribosomal protein L11